MGFEPEVAESGSKNANHSPMPPTNSNLREQTYVDYYCFSFIVSLNSQDRNLQENDNRFISGNSVYHDLYINQNYGADKID